MDSKFPDYSSQFNCGTETFYECFSKILATKFVEPCSPGALPFMPICKEINKSYWKTFWTTWNKATEGQCPKLCTVQTFLAEVIFSSFIKQARSLKALLQYTPGPFFTCSFLHKLFLHANFFILYFIVC